VQYKKPNSHSVILHRFHLRIQKVNALSLKYGIANIYYIHALYDVKYILLQNSNPSLHSPSNSRCSMAVGADVTPHSSTDTDTHHFISRPSSAVSPMLGPGAGPCPILLLGSCTHLLRSCRCTACLFLSGSCCSCYPGISFSCCGFYYV